MRIAFALLASLGVFVATLQSDPAVARESIRFDTDVSPGTIVIKTSQRRLYYVMPGGRAMVYPVGVGRAGKTWTGTKYINGMYRNPAWSPPAEVRRDKPSLPAVIPGGAPNNPMGVAALTLSGGDQYAIHGTNNPGSVGGFVSYGCIRMHNRDILDLFGRVSYGTPVIVTR